MVRASGTTKWQWSRVRFSGPYQAALLHGHAPDLPLAATIRAEEHPAIGDVEYGAIIVAAVAGQPLGAVGFAQVQHPDVVVALAGFFDHAIRRINDSAAVLAPGGIEFINIRRVGEVLGEAAL